MDSSTKFRKNLDVLLANDYRNKISDNVRRSINKKLEEGTILGDSPLGYLNKKRVDKEKVEVYFDPQRAELVKGIFENYATGDYSLDQIGKIASEGGLTTKLGNLIKANNIERIIKNPFYYGYMKYEGMLYKHVYPKLISKELYDACQLIKSGRKRSKNRRTEQEFILKGIVKCSYCNHLYSPEIKKEKYVYMRPTKGHCDRCFSH